MDNIAENAILTLEQKEFLISFMQSELNSLFYLTGGTSLSAFYLQHRLSEDLDFFTEQDVDIENILVFLRSIPAIKQISYERKYDRKIFLLEYPQTIFLKVEFTKYPFKQLAPPQDFGGLLVDSIQDILSNKLMAMTDRRDPKDYIDVYTIMEAYPFIKIKEAIKQTENKFGIKGVDSILSGRFLEPPLYEGIPLTKKISHSDIQHFFKETARTLIRNHIGNEI